MDRTLLACPISASTLAAVRAQARQISAMVGLEGVQQTRFSTAVSEIARNAVQYAAGGTVTFLVEGLPGEDQPQRLVARISDRGPGFEDLPGVLAGRSHRNGRASMGIAGSTRLVDHIAIESPASGGTVVQLDMELPRLARPLDRARVMQLASELAAAGRQSPLEELEQQNRELLTVHQELRDKQTELERADDHKNQFVLTLAHELRGPLSTLQMSLDLLRRQPDMGSAEIAKRHDVMQRQTVHLTKLVEDLLDAARVSQGKVVLQKEPAELNALITQAVEMTEGAIAAKDHKVSLELHASPLWVCADAPRLKQVICNLVQNSARYTSSHGAIAIKVRREDARAVIEVKDNGMGISPNDLPNIFSLFVQGDRARQGSEGGLGVGLTLVRRLVQDHGGTVVAASEGVDMGSQFTVSLPLASPGAC
ncbi:MAG: sensor histidine kinase [Variovorax sp.]